MDDAWFHNLSSPQVSSNSQSQPQHKRRVSLLQQPAEEKADVSIEAIQEAAETAREQLAGPPTAVLSRRAQSYSDFYDAVAAHTKRERTRRRSLQQLQSLEKSYGELEFYNQSLQTEDELLDQSHGSYTSYHEQLQLSKSHLDSLLHSTGMTLEVLSLLSGSFLSVQRQTDSFREQCESLIAEQTRLEALANGIDENSRYYVYLESMTRRLNAPGAANLVKGEDFLEMLSNLDNCLSYMDTHPTQREAPNYRSRYRLLLTRALTLIRHHLTKSLGDIASDISKRIQSGQLKDATHSALLYAKFRVPAPKLKTLGLEIQKRAVPTPEDVDSGREAEYLSLMRELYQSYSATRGRLMLPLVSQKMAELARTSQQSDVVAFSKSSISYMRGICLDEYDLWFEWFETDGALYEFLESMMEPMYDFLRPRIIHETKLEKLCELCAMIQGRYMETDSDEDVDDVYDSDGAILTASRKAVTRKLDFAFLVHPALEDAQTRLVFLALNVLRDGIENYKPNTEDLDWPKLRSGERNETKKGPVLSGKRNAHVPSQPAIQESDEAEELFNDSGTNLHTETNEWFPTLHKAYWLLRRIYRLVNSTVFDDLAHRIVHSTIFSLMYASQQISRSKEKSQQDGQLFLIVHLLHLKQQIVAFDIEFIPPDVEFDFSSVTNTFYELRERGNLWNPTSWMKLVTGAVGGGLLPKVVENMLDAKAELDGRLRTVINEFVNSTSNHIVAPIETAAISEMKAKGDDGFDAVKAVRTVRGLAEKDVPLIREKLKAFVSDARTRETLIAAIRDQVVMSYEDFFDNYGDGTDRKVSRKGKGRENDVLDPSIFAEVMERIFQVGMMVGESEGSNGDRHFDK